MNKQIYFLEGGSELDDPHDFRSLQSLGYECEKLTDLYREPEKLLKLKEYNPWGIYIFTTGIRNQYRKTLIDNFLKSEYIPKAIIFGSENSAMTYLDIARDLKKNHGTISYEYDFIDEKLTKIEWI